MSFIITSLLTDSLPLAIEGMAGYLAFQWCQPAREHTTGWPGNRRIVPLYMWQFLDIVIRDYGRHN